MSNLYWGVEEAYTLPEQSGYLCPDSDSPYLLCGIDHLMAMFLSQRYEGIFVIFRQDWSTSQPDLHKQPGAWGSIHGPDPNLVTDIDWVRVPSARIWSLLHILKDYWRTLAEPHSFWNSIWNIWKPFVSTLILNSSMQNVLCHFPKSPEAHESLWMSWKDHEPEWNAELQGKLVFR